jgi:hypothetical protein
MPAVKMLHQQSASNSKPGSPTTGLRRWGGSRNTSWGIRFRPFRCWSRDLPDMWPRYP